MLIHMLSKNMLPSDLRSTFEIPVWPYREGMGKVPTEFRDYLKQYTVFRYEDDYVGENAQHIGAIMIPDSEGTWAHQWESPISAFRHLVWVDNDTLEVIKWPNDRPEGAQLHQKIVNSVGDDYAWGEFNKPVQIHRCNAQMIHYISGHDTPANVAHARELHL